MGGRREGGERGAGIGFQHYLFSITGWSTHKPVNTRMAPSNRFCSCTVVQYSMRGSTRVSKMLLGYDYV